MDEEAFERVVMEHKDVVHGYAAMILRDPTEAQDIAQEALVRLWQHRARVEPLVARPWLMRTTHNLCIDRLRRRRARPEAPGEQIEALEADPAPDPEQEAGAEQLGKQIQRALGALGELDRSVLVLREIQGLCYEEIASVLGLPLGTLKARLHRARERLRTRLMRAGVTP